MQISSTHDGRAPAARRPRRLAALVVGAVILSSGVLAATAMPAAAVDCSTVPWMDTSKSLRRARRGAARGQLAAPEVPVARRAAGEQPAADDLARAASIYPVQVDCTPTVIYSNGPDGVHGKAGTTAWPGPDRRRVASGTSSSREQKGAIARRTRRSTSGSNVILGPGVASGRTPLSGRTPEYFGEDPLLSGLMAAANVRGHRGAAIPTSRSSRTSSTTSPTSRSSTARPAPRTWTSAPSARSTTCPTRSRVEESDPDSLMCSYNQINGVYACENPILTTSLRERDGLRRLRHERLRIGALHRRVAR